jgi:hypothetical protein
LLAVAHQQQAVRRVADQRVQKSEADKGEVLHLVDDHRGVRSLGAAVLEIGQREGEQVVEVVHAAFGADRLVRLVERPDGLPVPAP